MPHPATSRQSGRVPVGLIILGLLAVLFCGMLLVVFTSGTTSESADVSDSPPEQDVGLAAVVKEIEGEAPEGPPGNLADTVREIEDRPVDESARPAEDETAADDESAVEPPVSTGPSPSASRPETIDISINDTSASEALETVADAAGLAVVYRDSADRDALNMKLSFMFQGVAPADIVGAMSSLSGVPMSVEDGTIYVGE